MTSVMVLDGVTSFLRLKDVTNTSKCKTQTNYWREFFRKLEEAEDLKSVFVVLLCVRIDIDQL